jgi:adenylylsulfate kinase-like enzyme
MIDDINSLKIAIWFTGLPCSGKTTLAQRLKEKLDHKGIKTVHIDADDIRGKLSADLGFSERDRIENL